MDRVGAFSMDHVAATPRQTLRVKQQSLARPKAPNKTGALTGAAWGVCDGARHKLRWDCMGTRWLEVGAVAGVGMGV